MHENGDRREELLGVEPPRRPWWGTPWVWLAVAALSVALSIVLWRQVGFAFFFLPFLWLWRPRRR